MTNFQNDYSELFNKLSKHYFLADLLSFGYSNYLRRKLISNLNSKDCVDVIDLMCGQGNNLDLFESKEKINYIGYDFSRNMIYQAKKKYYPNEKIRFYEMDILEEHAVIEKADCIICTYGLKCIPEEKYENFVELIRNSLKNGGTFLLLDIQLPSTRFLRTCITIYLNTLCRLVSRVFIGNSDPVKILLSTLMEGIKLNEIERIFNERNFDITIEKKLNGAIISLKGVVNTETTITENKLSNMPAWI